MVLEVKTITPGREPEFTQSQQADINSQLQQLGIQTSPENDINQGLAQLDELLKTSTARLLELSDTDPRYQNWVSPDLEFQATGFFETGLTGEIICNHNMFAQIDPNQRELNTNDSLLITLNAILEGRLSYRSKLMQRLALTTHLGPETELTDTNSLEARRLEIQTSEDRLQLLGELLANTSYNEEDRSYRIGVSWKYNNPIHYIQAAAGTIFPLGRIVCYSPENRATPSEISEQLIVAAPQGSVLLRNKLSEPQGILIPVKHYYVPNNDSGAQVPDYRGRSYPLDETFLKNGGQKSGSFREETRNINNELPLLELFERIVTDSNLQRDVTDGNYYYYASCAASHMLENYHGEIEPQVFSLPLDLASDFFKNPQRFLEQLLSGGIDLGFELADCFSQHIHLDARWLDQGTADKYDPLLEIRKREADLSLESKNTIWVPVAFLIKDFFRVRPE